jgi:hypothetical protein
MDRTKLSSGWKNVYFFSIELPQFHHSRITSLRHDNPKQQMLKISIFQLTAVYICCVHHHPVFCSALPGAIPFMLLQQWRFG